MSHRARRFGTVLALEALEGFRKPVAQPFVLGRAKALRYEAVKRVLRFTRIPEQARPQAVPDDKSFGSRVPDPDI
jgi:hypothetical protein